MLLCVGVPADDTHLQHVDNTCSSLRMSELSQATSVPCPYLVPPLSIYEKSNDPLPSCCARAAHTGLHLLPALLGAGADKPVLDLLHSVLELHRNHARDAGDTVTMAFEAGSYTQARRFCGCSCGDKANLRRVAMQ